MMGSSSLPIFAMLGVKRRMRYLVLSPLLQWTVGSYIFQGPKVTEKSASACDVPRGLDYWDGVGIGEPC